MPNAFEVTVAVKFQNLTIADHGCVSHTYIMTVIETGLGLKGVHQLLWFNLPHVILASLPLRKGEGA